jgi:7-cyano-7-deazaguanine synthase
MSKAIVLLSGGMDSAVTAAVARRENEEVIALNAYYGQKHSVERECARKLVGLLKLDGYIELDLSFIFTHMRSSLLRLSNIPIDDNQPKNEVGATYVPGRNSIFLSIAAGIADSMGAQFVYYGAHQEDHAGYPDCRAEYFVAIRDALRLGTKNEVVLKAPFITKPKSYIVRTGIELGVPFEHTHSCYRGERPACGTCPTCQIRLQAFAEAGIEDPLPYRR